ncbi:MAG TPA: glycosyltransferase family 4 protein, partial [bacterium]|nr:glycosyltransferase family 4 protein [bacterium]
TQLFGDYVGRLAAYLSNVPVIISVEQNVNVGEAWHVYLVNRLTTGLLTRHIAISKAIQEFIIKRYHSRPEKTEVIYSGVNVNKFLIAEGSNKKNNSSPFVFGAIGRLAPQKGFAVLIKALQKIKSTNYTCLIAGEGPLRKDLQEQIDEAKLTDRVKLIGIQTDVKAFLGSLDFFVMPSIWEGLGLVALEAGLAALPVIASNVDGLREIIDETTGLLIPANNPEVLAASIAFCLDPQNNLKLKTLGQTLQKKVLDNFSLEASIRGYDRLYQKLLLEKHVTLYD